MLLFLSNLSVTIAPMISAASSRSAVVGRREDVCAPIVSMINAASSLEDASRRRSGTRRSRCGRPAACDIVNRAIAPSKFVLFTAATFGANYRIFLEKFVPIFCLKACRHSNPLRRVSADTTELDSITTRNCMYPVSYTHLTLPTSDLV